MRTRLRHLLPGLGLLLVPTLSFAESVESATAQEAPATQQRDDAQASGHATEGGVTAVQAEPEQEVAPTSATPEHGAATQSRDRGPSGEEAAEPPSEKVSPATSTDHGAMPHHAPLRTDAAEGVEPRRRVPLTAFNSAWALARFTESEPALHEKARSIAARSTASYWVSLGSSAATGVLLGMSLTAPSCESTANGPRCTPNLGFFLGALGTLVVGNVIAHLIAPDEKEVLELVDAWNATIDVPIVPEPGMNPAGTDVVVPEAASP